MTLYSWPQTTGSDIDKAAIIKWHNTTSLDERTRGKLKVCVISAGSYIWAQLVFRPLVYSISYSTVFKMSKKDIGDKFSALLGHWEKHERASPTLAPGCRHPPVN